MLQSDLVLEKEITTVTWLLVFLLSSLILKLSFSRVASGRGGMQPNDKKQHVKEIRHKSTFVHVLA